MKFLNPLDKIRDESAMPDRIALSFFSGAMGLDLGLAAAGFTPLLASDIDKYCRATILANNPEIGLIGDITFTTASQIRQHARISENDEIFLMSGGPPCQAFSTAGMRRGVNDVRGNVFLRFIDLAIELQPKYLVIENVRGLLSAPLQHRPHAERGSGKRPLDVDELPGGALQYVIDLLEKVGYSVEFNLYNAANYGVPQTRERVVMICAREGSRVGFLEPTHSQNGKYGLKPWRTFQEATYDLKEPHHHINFPEDRLKYYKLIGPGQHWRSLPLDLQKEAMGNSFFAGGGKTGFFRRVAWDKPAPTLVTHPAMPATDLAHPVEQRPLSIEEYRRLQMFPDGWIIQGPLIQQYKQLGNAVPVGLGDAVGRAIMGHEMGRVPTIPQGFEFSRYKNTSRDEWVAAHARETRSDGLFADL